MEEPPARSRAVDVSAASISAPPFWRGATMESVQYQRSQGLRATYLVEYDRDGYRISRDGRLRRARDLGSACQSMGRRERQRAARRFAFDDIEKLIGMEE